MNRALATHYAYLEHLGTDAAREERDWYERHAKFLNSRNSPPHASGGSLSPLADTESPTAGEILEEGQSR